jgi:sugar/nucleoside kinase (ribokinase family)
MPRSFDVYGLGHALVDLQYRVTAEFLRDAGLTKGVMSLVDDTRRQALAAIVGSPPLASSGGSAANTLISVANCGGRAYLACRLGRDAWGDYYQQDLERAGVYSPAGDRADGPTGQCLVFITPDADRTMNTCLGASADLGPEQIDPAVAGDSQYVYLEGYLVTSEPGFAACVRARELARDLGARVALTLSDPNLVRGFRPRLEQLVGDGVDLLFCNEEEALAYSGCTDRAAAAGALARLAPAVCVTCGPAGALICGDGQTTAVPGVPARVVDTTGAGDAFAGGVLYGLTHGHGLAESAWLGNCAAAEVVEHFGPRPSRSLRDEVPGILARSARS